MTQLPATNAQPSGAEPLISPLIEQQITKMLDLTRHVLEADDLRAALQGLLQPLAQATAWCYGEVWIPDEQLAVLHSFHIWHEDTPELAKFSLNSRGLHFTQGTGLLGTVWLTRCAQWIPDLTAIDPTLALHPERVIAAGLHSALLLPIEVQNNVVAILVFFAREARPINEPLIRLITLVATHIGVAIQRLQAQDALRALNSDLEARVAERTAALSAANRELERAARLKDEFLANMSHELRTPLNAILSLAESATEGIYGPLNPRQEHALTLVSESGRHLLSLINDILDLTKIESGKVELELDLVDIEELCAASVRMVRQLAMAKGLRISSTLDPLVDTIRADPRRLKQILVNLLSNAVKFTPQGGNISIELHGDPVAGVVHFIIADTGIGISDVDLSRLFKPFIQLDSRLDRRHEGTGLGLALVARLTELHGGGVSVSSTMGQGSRFTVSLPWQLSDESRPVAFAPPAPVHASIGASPLILLAEDNDLVRQTTSDYLEARGYRICTARNGVQTLAMARELQPEMILMDIQMPVMDGLEATRHLRADPTLATIPVLALTALAMVGDRERCLEAGANDYLSKPVRLSYLVERIEALRNTHR